eukprot:comp9798_c0_seq1/m.4754 comp9798_c0_seq1/g.4754  ORF comp9798_c0_seq1/g.4754 comp9798_c0_seq1/m.4754 type:complete len:130 (-) comp9798_c0_seq1:114-503(-)
MHETIFSTHFTPAKQAIVTHATITGASKRYKQAPPMHADVAPSFRLHAEYKHIPHTANRLQNAYNTLQIVCKMHTTHVDFNKNSLIDKYNMGTKLLKSTIAIWEPNISGSYAQDKIRCMHNSTQGYSHI